MYFWALETATKSLRTLRHPKNVIKILLMKTLPDYGAGLYFLHPPPQPRHPKKGLWEVSSLESMLLIFLDVCVFRWSYAKSGRDLLGFVNVDSRNIDLKKNLPFFLIGLIFTSKINSFD